MKKLQKMGLIVPVLISTIGCVSSAGKQYSSSPNIDIKEPRVSVAPIVADLEVKETKVKGTATMGFMDGMAPPVEDCKLSAIGNALLSSKADVLVQPFYVVEVNKSSITVNVEGFPAFYKNFKKIK